MKDWISPFDYWFSLGMCLRPTCLLQRTQENKWVIVEVSCHSNCYLRILCTIKLQAKFVRWIVWIQNWKETMANYKILPHRPAPHAERQSSTTPFKQFGLSALITCCACHESSYWLLLVSFTSCLLSLSAGYLQCMILSGLALNSNIQRPTFSYNLKQGWKVVEWLLWIERNWISLVFRSLL